MLEPFGVVESVRMMKGRATDLSVACGFVDMLDERAALRAIMGLNGKKIDGRQLKVRLGF